MNNGKKRKKTSHIGFCFFIVSIRCVSSKCVNSRPSEGSLELPGGRDRGEARGGTPYYGLLALGAAEAPRRPRICKRSSLFQLTQYNMATIDDNQSNTTTSPASNEKQGKGTRIFT